MAYRKHLQSAITELEQQIAQLQAQGFKRGHILPNPTSAGTVQYHWVCEGKKQYVKKAVVRQWQADCHRGKRIAELQHKVKLLKTL